MPRALASIIKTVKIIQSPAEHYFSPIIDSIFEEPLRSCCSTTIATEPKIILCYLISKCYDKSSLSCATSA